MKQYLLIIICLLVSICKAQQNNPFTLYTADKILALKGAVRSLVIYNIREETSGETTEEIYMRYFFTPQGAITHIISYNNGAEEAVSYYKYDIEERSGSVAPNTRLKISPLPRRSFPITRTTALSKKNISQMANSLE